MFNFIKIDAVFGIKMWMIKNFASLDIIVCIQYKKPNVIQHLGNKIFIYFLEKELRINCKIQIYPARNGMLIRKRKEVVIM